MTIFKIFKNGWFTGSIWCFLSDKVILVYKIVSIDKNLKFKVK